MLEVSLFRLYLLRALYLLMGVGLALHIGPQILMPDSPSAPRPPRWRSRSRTHPKTGPSPYILPLPSFGG